MEDAQADEGEANEAPEQTIQRLRARVAELEAENAKLQARLRMVEGDPAF